MKLIRWLDENLEESFLIVIIAISVVIIFVQVVMRYVFENSLSWSEELARYLFLYQIWIGASYAVKRTAHLRIMIIPTKFKGSQALWFDNIALLIWLGFSVFLATKSTTLTNIVLGRGQLSPAMRAPMGIAYMAVPIGCALMSFRLVQQIYLNVKMIQKKDGQEVSE